MAKNKGVAKRAKELRRVEAEIRNAMAKDADRRVYREGPPTLRPKPEPRPVEAQWPGQAEPPARHRVVIVTPNRTRGIAQPVDEPVGIWWAPGVTYGHIEAVRLRERRLAQYDRRTASAAPPKTRTSDIAPKRLGDGIKPRHHLRVVSVSDVFPAIGATAPTDDLTPSEVADDDRRAEIAEAVARDEAAERLET